MVDGNKVTIWVSRKPRISTSRVPVRDVECRRNAGGVTAVVGKYDVLHAKGKQTGISLEVADIIMRDGVGLRKTGKGEWLKRGIHEELVPMDWWHFGSVC